MDIEDHSRTRAVMTSRRTQWVLWLGRCQLVLLGVSTVVLTLWAFAAGRGFGLALLAIGFCVLWAKLLRGISDGSTRAWWGLAVVQVLQVGAAVLALLQPAGFDPLTATWLVAQAVLLGLLVL